MLFHYILLPLTITLASAETSLDSRSPRTPRHPLTTLLWPPFVPLRPPMPSRSVLLSRASVPREFTRGTHYWGVYSAVTVALATRLSPFFLLLRPSLPSFLTAYVKCIAREPVCQRGAFSTLQNFYFNHSPIHTSIINISIHIYIHEKRKRETLM